MPTSRRRASDEQRRAATRRRLVEAAGRAFLEAGFHRTQVAAIVAEAGVGQGTFYRHFDDKHGVIEALLDRVLEAFFEGMGPLPKAASTSLEGFRAEAVELLRRALEVLHRERDLVVLLAREGGAVSAAFAARLDRLEAELGAWFGRRLNRVARGRERNLPGAWSGRAMAAQWRALVPPHLLGRLGPRESRAFAERLVTDALLGAAGRIAASDEPQLALSFPEDDPAPPPPPPPVPSRPRRVDDRQLDMFALDRDV